MMEAATAAVLGRRERSTCFTPQLLAAIYTLVASGLKATGPISGQSMPTKSYTSPVRLLNLDSTSFNPADTMVMPSAAKQVCGCAPNAICGGVVITGVADTPFSSTLKA